VKTVSQVGIRLTEGERAALDVLAGTEEVRASDLVRQALRVAQAAKFEGKRYLLPIRDAKSPTTVLIVRLKSIDADRLAKLWVRDNPDTGRAIRSALAYAFPPLRRPFGSVESD
jgi:hypothetical protein